MRRPVSSISLRKSLATKAGEYGSQLCRASNLSRKTRSARPRQIAVVRRVDDGERAARSQQATCFGEDHREQTLRHLVEQDVAQHDVERFGRQTGVFGESVSKVHVDVEIDGALVRIAQQGQADVEAGDLRLRKALLERRGALADRTTEIDDAHDATVGGRGDHVDDLPMQFILVVVALIEDFRTVVEDIAGE